jgi:tetratricopeptide (TPR) repeat protein
MPLPLADPRTVEAQFVAGVTLEESGDLDGAARVYAELLETADDARAALNLGTILYNRREYSAAEELYRRATIADPGRALAWFDLGNALDELARIDEAIDAYEVAVRLCPTYADARYNLALAHERAGEPRRAIRHWAKYAKADPASPWGNHARLMVRRILDRDKLEIVWRRDGGAL